MLKILLIILFLISIITFFFIIGIKSKKQAVQTFTIPFFIHSFSNLTEKQNEDGNSFFDKINDFFNDKDDSDLVDDVNGGDGDHDDGGDA